MKLVNQFHGIFIFFNFQDTTFNKAQEIFKEALYAKELRLKILRNSNTGALISSSVDDIKDHNNAVEGLSNCNNNNRPSTAPAKSHTLQTFSLLPTRHWHWTRYGAKSSQLQPHHTLHT